VKSTVQNLKSKIVIVGAGPAGASLAIRLAQENYRVCLIERERFPRPKLCGEFISPECFEHFRVLGVLDEMFRAGGERIAETIFYAANGKSVGIPNKWFDENESGALGLSRAQMDLRLLQRAKSLGVEVWEETSTIGLLNESNKICGLKIRTKNGDAKEVFADLIIDATGRARVLGKLSEKESSRQSALEKGWLKIQNQQFKTQNRFVGFKAHLERVNFEKGVCEIYFFKNGYGGLSRVEDGLANFCFLVKAETVKEFSSDADKIIKKIIFQNQRPAETLKTARPVHDWLAVSVDGFGLRDLNPAANIFAVGDAGAFIDPFTGSGMLMALESAEILARAIIENSPAQAIAAKYKQEHARKFRRRLFICSLMRRAAFAPTVAKTLITALSVARFPRKLLAQTTRPR
jgi:flavin-dependent dehydrogenase